CWASRCRHGACCRSSRLLVASCSSMRPPTIPCRGWTFREEVWMVSHRKVAVVTGAGTGIGEATSKALAGAGFAIVLAGRRRDRLDAVAASIEGETLVAPTDVSDEDAVRALFEATRERF